MNETEWDSLSELWLASADAVDAAPLRKVVAAHRRRLLIASILEAALLAALAWLTYAVLRDGIQAWELVWAATLWSFAAVAVAFVWWSRRGTWRAIGDSVAEYVRLTRVRAERQRLSLRFGIALFVAEAIACAAQLIWFDRFTLTAVLLLGASAIAVAAWVVGARRRIARDLAMLEEYEET